MEKNAIRCVVMKSKNFIKEISRHCVLVQGVNFFVTVENSSAEWVESQNEMFMMMTGGQ